MFADPAFYLVSIPAVLLYGVAKGGWGGAIAILAVPLMSFVMPPTRAAAILLPILVVMDVFVLKTYWGVFDRRALKLLLPWALLGVGLGYLTAGVMNEHYMRLLVGGISLVFGLQYLVNLKSSAGAEHHVGGAGIFGALAGFTSFSIHAGGPPFSVYLMPKQLPPLVYAGTAGVFFAVVNFVKLLPYYSLGQFSSENLLYSLALVPLAPLGVKLGHFLVRHSASDFYYKVISFFLVVVGARLTQEGWTGLAQTT